jgi:hypothetical protein
MPFPVEVVVSGNEDIERRLVEPTSGPEILVVVPDAKDVSVRYGVSLPPAATPRPSFIPPGRAMPALLWHWHKRRVPALVRASI